MFLVNLHILLYCHKSRVGGRPPTVKRKAPRNLLSKQALMVDIRDVERRGCFRLRLSASHDESNDNDSTLWEKANGAYFWFLHEACIYIYIFFFNLILKCSLQAYVRHRNILISCIIEFLLASFQLKFIYFSNSVFKPKYISFWCARPESYYLTNC